ncbi:MAG: hypothetical protein ISR96_00990 [Nitrospira sp.]|nr:hypothetical protein [bacterium]MBL7048089.1 hypothetical protein [Nitrospira sp.]
MITQKVHEYMNDYMYFFFLPDSEKDDGSLIYCSGVNFKKFLSLSTGRHRPMANPAIRGLQLVNVEMNDILKADGAKSRATGSYDAAGLLPHGDGWYKEFFVIEGASETIPDQVTRYCVLHIMQKIINGLAMPEIQIPDVFLSSGELQAFIDNMSRTYNNQSMQ